MFIINEITVNFVGKKKIRKNLNDNISYERQVIAETCIIDVKFL